MPHGRRGRQEHGSADSGAERPGITKRGFLRLASGLAALGLLDACAGRAAPNVLRTLRRPRSPDPADLAEQHHLPALAIPSFTRNGAHVPIVVELVDPMELDHYIETLHIMNEGDPIPSKGTFHLTPANGHAYLATQARMRSGTSSVVVIAECNQHGRSVGRQTITIPAGGDGCVSVGDGPDDGEIRPPVLRIPALVSRGRIRRGEVIQVQVKFKHPSRTGLALHAGKYVQESDPFYVKTMDVSYGDHLVSRFEMTPAVSENPFITFALRATDEQAIRVVLTNSRGERFEATEEIALS